MENLNPIMGLNDLNNYECNNEVDMNACTKVHDNPSHSCPDISLKYLKCDMVLEKKSR